MCGIYGVLSSRAIGAAPGDALFVHLAALLESADPAVVTRALSDEALEATILKTLDGARREVSRFTGRAGILHVLTQPALVERLASVVKELSDWVDALEAIAERPGEPVERYRESLNRLTVGARDIAWQIAEDVLANLASVRGLTRDDSESALARAWSLNLVLRSLDRLEVRGRDSAGIAVYVRFRDAASLEQFLDGSSRSWRSELASREDPRFGHRAVLRPKNATNALLFGFKVAAEVGKMGDNVAALRRSIFEDALFQAVLAAEDVEVQAIAHTRWASNGVISIPNCHPVDSAVLASGDAGAGGAGSVGGSAGALVASGALVAVLNGDVDNYPELVEKYVRGAHETIDPTITTDAKIVPVVVEHFLRQGLSLEEAFTRSIAEFEGSMAIGVMAADRPGEFLFAQKGSGQGLFFGIADETVAVASEMYGVVELTPRYLKAEGERVEGGEIFRLRSRDSGVDLECLAGSRFVSVPEERVKRAEITTRDINRAGYPHFFVKEIAESVASVRKTLRGKFDRDQQGDVRFRLGESSIPTDLVNALRAGTVKRVVVIGQGTAAVAAQGVAHLLEVALRRLPEGLTVVAQKATEFSAHGLRESMSDTLVVAVSQSGTTTDTNRTVDLVRQRGAWVLAIVNRRNSDLVYKSHAVLYTSDGRDIEMSVASTKAFYAQNVAGQILALALASALGTLEPAEIRAAVDDLERLPGVLERTLETQDHVAALTEAHSLRRRHWAVVGSGPGKIAADEVRIKLSELCYKSIAVDYLEDKKHIDLSSEPLVIVCAVGMPREIVSDAIKEVAIFKAHSAIPIVITEEGESGFDTYAAGTVKVPAYRGALSYLPATMAGHLFGYYAAVSMDRVADRLRALRSRVVGLCERGEPGDISPQSILERLASTETSSLVELEDMLESGALDGGLDVAIAVRLSRVLGLCLGRLPIDAFERARPGASVLDAVVEAISDAIAALSRPVDAIKHQAKTVTVGISRGDAGRQKGALAAAIEELALSESGLLETHRRFLAAFDALVESVDGVTTYRVSGLDAVGRPNDASLVRVEEKRGIARRIPSRNEAPAQLTGNKWGVLKRRRIFLGRGQRDQRKILIVPFVGQEGDAVLALFHLELNESADREQRLRALEANEAFYDRLRAAVTEVQLDWDASLIDGLSNETLFLNTPERVAELLAHAQV